MKKSEINKAAAIESLKPYVSKGDRVWVNIKSVSRSAMQREMTVHVVKDKDLIDITAEAAEAIGFPMKGWNMLVRGCGMDMTHLVVSKISTALFGKYDNLKHAVI